MKANLTTFSFLEKILEEPAQEKIITQILSQFKPKTIYYILDLVKDFFEFYGQRENLTGEIICLWKAEFLTREDYKQRNPNTKVDLTSPLCIQSAFDPDLNIGSTTPKKCLKRFQRGCQQTAARLQVLLRNEVMTTEPGKDETHAKNLMDIFAPIEKEIHQPPPEPESIRTKKKKAYLDRYHWKAENFKVVDDRDIIPS